MNTIAQWLTEDGNIVVPKTLDTQVFDENGKSLNRRLKTAKDEQIIQLPKVNPTLIVSDLDYSTEEQLTGRRWIDGKPIYQKSIEFMCPGHGFNNVIYEFTDFDKCIGLSGFCQHDTYSYLNISSLAGYFEGGENVYEYFALRIKNKSLYLTVSKGLNVLAGKPCYCTVQYTKATDTASSPVTTPKVESMHNYSTEEKVVGMWNDKPLYEKTFFAVAITNNTENFVSDNFGDKKLIHFQPDFNGMSNNLTSQNDFNDTLFINSSNQLIYYFYRKSTWWEGFNTADITVQYTKTTDTPTT